MGESRQELLAWLNGLLGLNLTKVEQCGTGAPVCQIYDSIYRDVPLQRVKFNVNAEYAYIENWKILAAGFSRWGIDRQINIQQLVRCKMQDNLEFLQWTKRHWDQYYPGDDYDARDARRHASVGSAPTARAAPASARTSTTRRPAGNTPTTGVARNTPHSGGSASALAALREDNNGLRETVAGLEKERDFYFSKLRDIELLIQQAFEEQPELENQDGALLKQIQTILYSTEEGFEIPAEADGEVDGEDGAGGVEDASAHGHEHGAVAEEETF